MEFKNLKFALIHFNTYYFYFFCIQPYVYPFFAISRCHLSIALRCRSMHISHIFFQCEISVHCVKLIGLFLDPPGGPHFLSSPPPAVQPLPARTHCHGTAARLTPSLAAALADVLFPGQASFARKVAPIPSTWEVRVVGRQGAAFV